MRTIIASLLVLPVGTESPSLSHHVAEAVKALEGTGVKFRLGPTSTSLEAKSLEDVFKSVKAVHNALFKAGVQRVMTFLSIDDRRDVKSRSLNDMVEAVEKHLRR